MRLNLRTLGIILMPFFLALTVILVPTRQAAAAPQDCIDSGGKIQVDREGSVVGGIDASCVCPDGKEFDGTRCVNIGTTKVDCPNTAFFGLSSWYKYLQCDQSVDAATGVVVYFPRMNGLQDIWRVVAALIEILLRLSSVIAIGFIVYGGFIYTLSQGAPDKTSAALKTIISALVGLVISIVAAAVVGFIAGRFSNTSNSQPAAQSTTTPVPITTQQQPR